MGLAGPFTRLLNYRAFSGVKPCGRHRWDRQGRPSLGSPRLVLVMDERTHSERSSKGWNRVEKILRSSVGTGQCLEAMALTVRRDPHPMFEEHWGILHT